MAITDFFIHTVTIKRPVNAKDSVGGRTLSSETTLHTNIPACVQPVSSNTQLIYSTYDIKLDTQIFTDRDVSNVVVGDLIYFNSFVFTVVGIRNLMMNSRLFHIMGYTY